MSTAFPIAKNNETELMLLAKLANRHGLIAGATGTGKTVTLRVMAEEFSKNGIPVFMADVKGDLSGIALAGEMSSKMQSRLEQLVVPAPEFSGYPVVFWDVFAQKGHPVRTTISEMGPLLLAEILNLNDTQAGVLNIVFKVADEHGLLLLDLKDLRAMIHFTNEYSSELQGQYGNISPASIGAIQRNLLALEEQGGDVFFGEPALNLADFMQTDTKGKGQINILAADKLLLNPKLYATFLLWMMSELFETLPEVGDVDKPKLVFFFDEAHLLFNNAPASLQQKIEQVVRLIRSKGVGIYFISQSPSDIPDNVLGQLGNRVQHALRAFTPRDQKAVKIAAETFRPNPQLDTAQVITELGVGEALVSFLDENGIPTVVERAWVLPPTSRFTPLTDAEREQVIKDSVVYGVYEKTIDRESAYEMLQQRAQEMQNQAEQDAQEAEDSKAAEVAAKQQAKEDQRAAVQAARAEQKRAQERTDMVQDVVGTFAKSAARSLGGKTGQALMRGILGSLFK